MKFWEIILAKLRYIRSSSKNNPQLMLPPASKVEVMDKVINMATRSKAELRDEIQKRINGIAKAENGVDRVVIVGAFGTADIVSEDGSRPNDEDKIVKKLVLFGSRALSLIQQEAESDFNDDAGDLGEVELVLEKRSNSVLTIVANSNPDFSIVFYGKLEPRRFGPHTATVTNDYPRIISLYKEMLDAY